MVGPAQNVIQNPGEKRNMNSVQAEKDALDW